MRKFLIKVKTFILGESLKHQFLHFPWQGIPAVEIKIQHFEPSVEDVEIAARITRAFDKARLAETQHGNTKETDLWDVIISEQHEDLKSALRNPQSLAGYLCNFNVQGIAHGISDFNTKTYLSMRKRTQRQLGALIKDSLVTLGEAVGALPYYSSQNIPHNGDNLKIVSEIEKTMGIKIEPPVIDGGLPKANIAGYYFSLRDVWALYTAWRINSLLGDTKSCVAEIGCGIGKTALFSNRLGIKDYSLFDLPHLNIIQAWYLIKALPDAEIVLYGETPVSDQSIKILPYWNFPGRQYDLVVNVDSFPEIDREIVLDYLRKIHKSSKRFLSVNHEKESFYYWKHGNVPHKKYLLIPRLIEEEKIFKRISRSPFWVRKGYVEELYVS